MNEDNKNSQMSFANTVDVDFPKNKLDVASENLQAQFANPKGEKKQADEREKEDLKLDFKPPETDRFKELKEISDEVKARTEAQKQLELKNGKGFGNDGWGR